MAAFQVRIAYFTPHRRSKHYFHQLVLAADQHGAIADARAKLIKRSPNAHIVHAAAALRPDSRDAEAAILPGWKLRDNWWKRPIRAIDDLAVIASHGYANSRQINTRTTAGCVAIDRELRNSAGLFIAFGSRRHYEAKTCRLLFNRSIP